MTTTNASTFPLTADTRLRVLVQRAGVTDEKQSIELTRENGDTATVWVNGNRNDMYARATDASDLMRVTTTHRQGGKPRCYEATFDGNDVETVKHKTFSAEPETVQQLADVAWGLLDLMRAQRNEAGGRKPTEAQASMIFRARRNPAQTFSGSDMKVANRCAFAGWIMFEPGTKASYGRRWGVQKLIVTDAGKRALDAVREKYGLPSNDWLERERAEQERRARIEDMIAADAGQRRTYEIMAANSKVFEEAREKLEAAFRVMRNGKPVAPESMAVLALDMQQTYRAWHNAKVLHDIEARRARAEAEAQYPAPPPVNEEE